MSYLYIYNDYLYQLNYTRESTTLVLTLKYSVHVCARNIFHIHRKMLDMVYKYYLPQVISSILVSIRNDKSAIVTKPVTCYGTPGPPLFDRLHGHSPGIPCGCSLTGHRDDPPLARTVCSRPALAPANSIKITGTGNTGYMYRCV